MNNDKGRLQQYSNTTQPSQQIKKPQMTKTITVCGIGEVNQIC
jgi:hypothetical protein